MVLSICGKSNGIPELEVQAKAYLLAPNVIYYYTSQEAVLD